MEMIIGMVHTVWREIIPPTQHESILQSSGPKNDQVGKTGDYKRLSVNVSQAFGSPLSKPRRSQVARCSDEPCVQVSGCTDPLDIC